MSRSLRLEHPGALWHITSRGNARRDIYCDDADRRRFLDILAEVAALHRWIVYAYVLMSNHYHLLVETPQPTLSVGSKRLNERFAQAFNRENRRVGHLFQGRFKAILVEKESHFLELLRYIVLNPVRCGSVRYPEDYEWSSYRATAGLCHAPGWLATSEVLEQFGPGTLNELSERYRRFVADGRGAEYKPWEQLVGQIYLGGSGFCDRMQELVGLQNEVRAFPEEQRRFVRPDLDAIVELVGVTFGRSEAQLRQLSHHPARKAFAQLAWQEAGISLAGIGEWLGISGPAASQLARKSIELERRDDQFAAQLREIRRQITMIEAAQERVRT